MQSGRILPVLRQFFTPATKAGNAYRDGNSPQGQSQPERDATEEEANRAAELLNQSEEFQKNGLSAKAGQIEGRIALFVTDGAGNVLRNILGADVWKILLVFGGAKSPRHGRILDRRI